MHALNLDALRKPNITFWSIWSEPPSSELMGCCALMELDSDHAEIKSMRTVPAHLRKGVASRLLEHIITEARRRGYQKLSLETGAGAAFLPAQTLYAKFGFTRCGRFASYVEDPNSVFMTRDL
jgi:putative acetyltransferase